jgi:hypothetical protein
MPGPDASLAAACQNAFDKGYAWYLRQQQPDGSLGVEPELVPTFRNAFYLYALGGRWEQAHRFARWARSRLAEADGSLRVDPQGRFGNKAVYYKSWFMWGAHYCRLFDLSLGALEALLACQDSRWGGFHVSRQACQSGGPIELCSSGMAGLACLATGALRAAVAVGDFHVQLFAMQADWSCGLHGYFDPQRGALITSCGADMDKYLFYYDNQSEEIQPYANLAPSLAFLCYLHQATGRPQYLDAARRLFDFLDAAGERCWIRGQSTKILWGLTLLYEATGDERIMAAVGRLAGHLCDIQLTDGRWPVPLFGDLARQPLWLSLNVGGDILLSLAAAAPLLAGHQP